MIHLPCVLRPRLQLPIAESLTSMEYWVDRHVTALLPLLVPPSIDHLQVGIPSSSLPSYLAKRRRVLQTTHLNSKSVRLKLSTCQLRCAADNLALIRGETIIRRDLRESPVDELMLIYYPVIPSFLQSKVLLTRIPARCLGSPVR